MAYQTWYLDPTAAWKYPADVFISIAWANDYKDLWAVRTTVGSIDPTEQVDILSTNRSTLETFANMKARVSFLALEEQKLKVLKTFFNFSETLTPGTPVAVTNEAIGTDLPSGTIYTFVNKNGAGTQVASITISGTGWALVLNTDYKLGVDSQGYTYAVFLNATTGATDVDYTYTPNESEAGSLTLWNQSIKRFDIKFVAYKDTKTRTFEIKNAKLLSVYETQFSNVSQDGDLTGANLEFESDSGSVSFYDEIL